MKSTSDSPKNRNEHYFNINNLKSGFFTSRNKNEIERNNSNEICLSYRDKNDKEKRSDRILKKFKAQNLKLGGTISLGALFPALRYKS